MVSLPRLFSVRYVVFLFFFIAFTGFVFPAYALTPLSAGGEETKRSVEEEFIQNLGDKAIEILTNAEITEDDKSQQFRALMRDSFNLQAIARFVLGRNWRTASKEERQEYMDLFEGLVIKTYSDRFSLYTGEGFVVTSSKKEGQKDFVVNSNITRPNGAPSTNVAWRVRNYDNKIGVIDVMVEGVSMSVTQRQEYASVIQRNGGEIKALLELMRERLGPKQKDSKPVSKAS